MEFQHKSVLLQECIDALNIRPDGIYLDGTLGGAGHSSQIARRLTEGGRLIGVDRDRTALAAAKERLAPYADRVTLVHSNFAEIDAILDSLGIPAVDGMLFDLGVSSPQLDDASRGFSYMADAPLDMRMDKDDALTAGEVVNTWPQGELRRILYDYGEERYAPQIAAAICRAREKAPIETTLELVDIIRSAMPAQALREFEAGVDVLYVIEEGSTYLTDAVRALGVRVADFPCGLPRDGELSPGLIRAAFGQEAPAHAQAPADVPGRPPALCAGCPHRLVFKELSRIKAVVTGDIGCYTLGALPPLSAMDTCIDMGASVSMSHGFELAWAGTEHRPVVAVIGDSTFAHSGLSALISTVYNKGAGTVCVLDNRTTAMTGRQGNPFNGETLQHRPSRELDLEGVLHAIGVPDVRTVDPNDMKAVRLALREATRSDELSVIVFRSPCVLIDRIRKPAYVVADTCTACGVCTTLGCPAIAKTEDGHAVIDGSMCIGCGQCEQYCAFKSIVSTAKEGE